MADESSNWFIAKAIGIGTAVIGAVVSWISGKRNSEKTAVETLGSALDSLSKQVDQQQEQVKTLQHECDELRKRLNQVQDQLHDERRQNADAVHLIRTLISQVNNYAKRLNETPPYDEAAVMGMFKRT